MVADAHRFGVRGVSLSDQQIQHHRMVVSTHSGQRARLAPDPQGDRLRITRIAFAAVPGDPSTSRRPARIDLEDRLPAGDQTLRQTAPVVPRALDPPLPCLTQPCRPLVDRVPAIRAVGSAPAIDDPTCIIHTQPPHEGAYEHRYRSTASATPSFKHAWLAGRRASLGSARLRRRRAPIRSDRRARREATGRDQGIAATEVVGQPCSSCTPFCTERK